MPPANRVRSFLDTGLDWTRDGLSAVERDGLISWYAEHHEDGEEAELSKFPGFMIEHDPSGFKRYRRQVMHIDAPRDGVRLPEAAHLLLLLQAYVVVGYDKGIAYLVINARRLGASREEVLDVIRLAAVAGGPLGMNATAEIADEYLRSWIPAPGGEPGLPWPDDWAPDPAWFASGLDTGSADMSPKDERALAGWYRRVYGEVPSHVRALLKLHPTALKLQRLRFEGAVGATIPAQLVPLCGLVLAAMRTQHAAVRRAVQMAIAVGGVRRHHLVEALMWAAVYGDDIVLESAFDAAGDLLEQID